MCPLCFVDYVRDDENKKVSVTQKNSAHLNRSLNDIFRLSQTTGLGYSSVSV